MLQDDKMVAHGFNINFRYKANPLLDSLKKLSSKDSIKYLLYYKNALNARKQTDTIFNYLQSIKEVIAMRSGGWYDDTKSIVIDDKNLDIPVNYFLNEGHGYKLHDSLKKYISIMMIDLPEQLKDSVKIKIDISDPSLSKDGDKISWEEYYWEGVPSIAAITELIKFQEDVQFAESDVISANYKYAVKKYNLNRH